MTNDSMFMTYALIIFAYLFPFVLALSRRHHNSGAIGALTILLGWTILGWVGAFIWACTYVRTVEDRQEREIITRRPHASGGAHETRSLSYR